MDRLVTSCALAWLSLSACAPAPDGRPTALDVTVRVDAWDGASPVFRIRDPEHAAKGAKDLVVEPHLHDARGELPLTSEVAVDPRDGERKYELRAARSATGRLVLRTGCSRSPPPRRGHGSASCREPPSAPGRD